VTDGSGGDLKTDTWSIRKWHVRGEVKHTEKESISGSSEERPRYREYEWYNLSRSIAERNITERALGVRILQ
jgi:hypothetical protein